MKKLFILALSVVTLASCDQFGKGSAEQAMRERDSLMQIINQRDDELDEIMGAINEVQEGFRRINEAEGRVTIANGQPEGASTRSIITENMQYIQQAMQQNREMIAQLQDKLKKSNVNAKSLERTIHGLQEQLEAQGQRIQELEAQLAEKDILIAEQGDQIDNLSENVNSLTQENRQKSETMAAQDKDLHTAWFVFGTKAELKEQKILKDGDVLKTADFNKDYFTQCDIRVMKEIKLYSKSAQILTTHPAGSYTLQKDEKGEYVLRITEANKFWSVSKFLVIRVK
jgi:chromosome segregation ATPase